MVPPGSACLPLGRRLHAITVLKRWPVVLCIGILHRHPFAPTQSGAPLIVQGVRYAAVAFTRIMGVLDFLLYNSRRYMLSGRKTVA